jgi:hypothetical protein
MTSGFQSETARTALEIELIATEHREERDTATQDGMPGAAGLSQI